MFWAILKNRTAVAMYNAPRVGRLKIEKKERESCRRAAEARIWENLGKLDFEIAGGDTDLFNLSAFLL